MDAPDEVPDNPKDRITVGDKKAFRDANSVADAIRTATAKHAAAGYSGAATPQAHEAKSEAQPEPQAAVGTLADIATNSQVADSGELPSDLPTHLLSFFERGSEPLQVNALQTEDGSFEMSGLHLPVTKVKTPVAWSPTGSELALVDSTSGVIVVEFPMDEEPRQHNLEHSSTEVKQMDWSPCSTFLVTQSPFKSDENEANVQVWKISGGPVSVATFQNKQQPYNMFQWTPDEQVCCYHLQDGSLKLLPGDDLTAPPLAALSLSSQVQAVQFAPSANPLMDQMAVFYADTRDAMQRVAAPASIQIFKLKKNSAGERESSEVASVSIKFGQSADLLWAPTGTAVLVNCTTEVDDTGESYYGSSKLVLISHDGKFTLDLTEEKSDLLSFTKKSTAVQAVSWSPSRDEFVLIQGFQPAKTTLWVWDPEVRKCEMVKVLAEKAHRNTVRWNDFGSMVCIAGFGNLAGEVDFFGRVNDAPNGLEKVSSCEASCTVSSEWAPDGRHLMAAVLAPRMRVDNGLSVWCALSGRKVAELNRDELFEVQWRPQKGLPGLSFEQIKRSMEVTSKQATANKKEKKAYRPPNATGGNMVSQMMKDDPDSYLEKLFSHVPAKDPVIPEPEADVPKPKLNPLGAAAASGKRFEDEKNDRRPNNVHGEKLPCPETGWQYKDPKGNIQGPFTLAQMQSWLPMGVFKPDLPMRCDPSDKFIKFKELFPHPLIPFQSYPKRPQPLL